MDKRRQGLILLIALSALLVGPAGAEVQPAGIFCDHMVVQRDKTVPVWGLADPGEKVTVSFAGQSKSATAGKDGKWMVKLSRLAASAEGQKMTIAGAGGKVTIRDVLVGDVWLCSGQSNMGRSVDRSVIPPGMKWSHPTIRFWGAGRDAPYPIERYENAAEAWTVCADEQSTRRCCAVGFFFARRIQREVDVPVGLLWHAWAGSIIQEWIPPDAWRTERALSGLADRVERNYPNSAHGREVWQARLAELKQWTARAEAAIRKGSPFPHPQPLMPEPGKRDVSGFYNGKIHASTPFALKGFLWYQGESDMRNAQWALMLKVMARSWRERFSVDGDGREMPFYWIQIQRSGDYCSTLNRQQAFNALKLVPNGGMAVLLDLDVNVHPANKVDTGIRLARWALHRDYGKNEVVASGPLFKSHRAEGDRMIVEFHYADGGLRIGEKDMLQAPVLTTSGELTNLELAGKDGKWHEAVGKLDGARLVVTSKDVPRPVEVRYAFKTVPSGPFLYNAAGLPAAMFSSVPD